MIVATFKRISPLLILILGLTCGQVALAQEPPASGIPGIPAVTVQPGDGEGAQEYSVTLQILALMTALTFLPAMLMMMTSFTRIIVVFAILRQALGLQATPSNQILLGLALFLTIFIMKPVFEEANRVGLQPYLQEQVTSLEAVELASEPVKKFMLAQTRESDLALFIRMADEQYDTPEDVSFWVLMPAFVTSELKTAFQIGFILFIPFLIIDMVVASVLMAMGMMMLSPIIISLPFKIMLFVLVDGWALIMGTLAASYGL
ncbi:flagellar type III secretion system pore protein FliP [Marinobacter salinexigens]|uniref:Flagellar biosynthetic protein FliP n=1 Tax=Marinobacter salinexigens TaxID=2919747 RepID=A0A5B0VJA7_9GAMM|nr:flagellar type III secretion system pore protein FliP [Marinobacter salinexigens]KAA1174787.1 flagellar type III secretion system pore protein FliP [Marinobacter salinexigens]